MPVTRSRKEELVEEYKNALQKSSSVAFVFFKGLTVEENDQMRAQLTEAGVNFRVVKKTLFNRALDEVAPEGEKPPLDAEVAIAWGDDLLAPAREVHRFGKDHPEQVQIIGGIYDGVYMSQEEMLNIATIPDHHTLLGMFVNVINSPIQGLAVSLNQIAEKKETA